MRDGQLFRKRMVYNLLGFRLAEDDLLSRLDRSADTERLMDVAMRLCLVDQMRRRMRLRVGPHGSAELAWDLGAQLSALQMYLLCTCIDALASPRRHPISFAEWLAVGRRAKKAEYGLLECTHSIQGVIDNASPPLTDPDGLRRAARRLYDEVYCPRYGARKSFLGFFPNLPPPMQLILTEGYVVGRVSRWQDAWDCEVWEQARSNWAARKQDDKLYEIATYLYRRRRNPYTHRAVSTSAAYVRPWPTMVFDEWGFDRQDARRVVADVDSRSGTSTVVWFVGDPGDDEVLLLRLVVSVAWLSALDYHLTDEHILALRRHQARCDALSAAVDEIGQALLVADFYATTDRVLEMQGCLPSFPCGDVSEARAHLNSSSPLERSIDGLTESYLGTLERLNEPIHAHNRAFLERRSRTADGVATLQASAAATRTVVSRSADLASVKELGLRIHEWLDLLSDTLTGAE